jgi:hypothetical protein
LGLGGLVLLGLVAGAITSHRYKKSPMKPCSTCNTPTSNTDSICSVCLKRAEDDRLRRREQDAAAERTRREQAEAQRVAVRLSSSVDPYAVLGVPKGATRDQIRTAYRTLIVQYHSDTVAQLGPELQRLAAEKSQQINEAYRLLERGAR